MTNDNEYKWITNSDSEEHEEYHIGIGSILHNQYQVICQLGAGGFSNVWLCRDLSHTASVVDVAVKVLKTGKEGSAVNEIQCLQSVRHNEFFVKLLDHFHFNYTQPCLVLEVSIGSLLDVILVFPNGIILPGILTVAKQMLKGLHYLHTMCNIIHLDIKLENILVCDKELRIKIADFGSSRKVDSECNYVNQTMQYRSPEVILMSGCDPKTDIWSLACVLFELSTGDYLFYPLSNEHHLTLIIQLLGKIPKHICLKGKGLDYFSPDGILKDEVHLVPFSLHTKLTQECIWDENSAIEFADFLLPMLECDPDLRLSASECLSHRWMCS